jgi:3-phenylpropionate/trans-cinnamate dioxygenase ferredoxin reductase subunit
MMPSRIVVIGGGAGSAAAVAELRKQGFDGSLTLVSAENTVPYERPPLSKGFLLGTSGQVPVKDAAWYEQASVELILGSRATGLDLAARSVTLSGGAVLGYDQLLLATGVRPRVLPGLDGDGVCYLRTGEDAAALRDRMTAAGHVAVLGCVDDFRVDWQWIPAWRPADITDSGREQLRAIGFTV